MTRRIGVAAALLLCGPATADGDAVPEGYALHKLPAADDADRDEDANRASAFDARFKWFSAALELPADDALRRLAGADAPLRHSADFRVLWRGGAGAWRLAIDHSTSWARSDLANAAPGLALEQAPTGDERRLLDLAWRFDDGRLAHRFDRLALERRTAEWAVTIGRQAVSWGGGLVFQPMDLFNPFAPTTVDQDYKAGDDLLLVERLFANGSDLQLLAVGRRAGGGFDPNAGSVAVKYRTRFGAQGHEVELLAARHYASQVAGLGLRVPLGGALLRSDVTWTQEDGRRTVSGVLNADYSIGVAGTIVHLFGEYFHNGFGVGALPADPAALPPALTRRVARGELFNLMRNYLALGASFRWTYLLNQSVAVIANLRDGSWVAQASLTYEASDASRLQAGFAKPVGGAGEEFGGIPAGEGRTTGGGAQGFLRFVYYF